MALFFKRLQVSLPNLASYGLLTGVGQSGLLFIAMKGHVSSDITLLVVQPQTFMTIDSSVFRGP